jgi:hypothetical protein
LARSIVGKAVWNLLIEAASGVSGHPDDTAAVAIWSFLHGYVTLEHSGAFGGFRAQRWTGAGHGSLIEQLPQSRRACWERTFDASGRRSATEEAMGQR